MNYDIYLPVPGADGKMRPGTKAKPMCWLDIWEMMSRDGVKNIIRAVQQGDKDAKKSLPAVTWMGQTTTGRRLAADCRFTQLVMIDIDHCAAPHSAWLSIEKQLQDKSLPQAAELSLLYDNILLVHITPSGKGLRIVFRAIDGLPSIEEQLNYVGKLLQLQQYGDFDTQCKDISRLSFLPCTDMLLFVRAKELHHHEPADAPLKNLRQQELELPTDEEPLGTDKAPEFTDEEKQRFDGQLYRGHFLREIIDKYVEVNGTPGDGERHAYYNDMVKKFRCITDNDKRLLLYLLPRFGHTVEECQSQIQSICRSNTLSRLPRDFYFFLKDNGFYTARPSQNLSEQLAEEEEETAPAAAADGTPAPPPAPPVFREILRVCPPDFVLPTMNALLPIMGTLTSYLRADYPYDGREHTTSFFSVIYAPPGTGKGFVERFLDLFFEELRLRDLVQSERENIYLRVLQRKGANEKAPEQPHVSMRIIPPKNSEPEFLQKQKDNHGYHMFTYAAEMDSWAKGVRAAGGNKDDMIRIAWDNGEYGQQFKSPNTFKGVVRLYWNVLITGTIAQVENYFKNVENGLVTRCGFTAIENQEFQLPPQWRTLTKRELKTISDFCKRCDALTYETPCTVLPEELSTVSDEDFDKQIDWRFQFRPFKHIDMSWIMPVIEKFHKEQLSLASANIDRARDVFRRRVGVRGFRLAMICYACYANPRKTDLERICQFVDWWMHRDIENILKLWGNRYNETTETATDVPQRSVFQQLPEKFSRAEIYTICTKQGIKTPLKMIIHLWKKQGLIKKTNRDEYKKI